jgi:hypothetical protein
MRDMFDRIQVSDQASPEACRAIVEKIGGDAKSPVALLLADQPGLDLEAIVLALSHARVPVIGGVFPALISQGKLMTTGAIAIGFGAPAKRLAIRNLFEARTVLEAAASQLLVDPKESQGHTIFAWIDGQAAGSASMILDVLRALFFHLGADFIGGGAGYWSMGTRPCLFTEQEVLPPGAGIVLRIDHRTMVRVEHGWAQLAGPFYASRAVDTTVIELDWRPAIDVYEEVLGPVVGGPIRGEAFPMIAKLYPLAVQRLRDTLIVRDPLAITEEGGLFTLGQITESSLVAILRAEAEGLLSAASSAARSARQDVHAAEGRLPDSAFIADCVSRSEALGVRFSEELERLRRELDSRNDGKHTAVAGALTLGEIASRGERFVDFYNKTVVVAAR